MAASYGIAQKATQEVLGHSDANLTANIYTEMASETIRSDLNKLPRITKNGIEKDPEDYAPNCGAGGQTASEAVKVG